MDYEKKYKEALENMRRFRDALNNHEETDLWVLKKGIVTDIEYYFPELKESEDEKIRKALLNHLTKMWGNSQDDVCGIHVEDAIAWLEKQGKKSAAWSDEDEKMYKIALSCIETLEDISNGKNMHADVKEWLKRLKDRIGG